MMTNAHCPKKLQSSCSNGSFDQVKNLSLWPLHICCRKFSLINLQGFAVWFWQMLITKMTFKKLDLIFQISNFASTFLRSGKSTRAFQRATQVPFCTARESSLKPEIEWNLFFFNVQLCYEQIIRWERLTKFIFYFSERGEGDKDLLHSVYNHETGEFIIPSFKVRTLSPDYEFLTRVPDHVILQNFSTSPKVEPAYFSSEVRDSIKMVLAHPQIEKSIFREKRPKIYKRNKDSIWTLTSN